MIISVKYITSSEYQLNDWNLIMISLNVIAQPHSVTAFHSAKHVSDIFNRGRLKMKPNSCAKTVCYMNAMAAMRAHNAA